MSWGSPKPFGEIYDDLFIPTLVLGVSSTHFNVATSPETAIGGESNILFLAVFFDIPLHQIRVDLNLEHRGLDICVSMDLAYLVWRNVAAANASDEAFSHKFFHGLPGFFVRYRYRNHLLLCSIWIKVIPSGISGFNGHELESHGPMD